MSSDRVDQLDNAAEVFYRRLMSKVDDHGLYDARPSMLRSSLYPLRADRVREADISRWMAACQKAGLIALYSHDGKPYLAMLDTRWEARSKPKWPLPPENICKQPETPVPVVVVGVVVEDGGGNARKRATPAQRKTSIPEGFGISDRVREWAHEKGYANLDVHLDAFVRKSKAKGYAYIDWDLAFMEAIREDWAKVRGGRGGMAPPPEVAVPKGPDPELERLKRESQNATAMPASVREFAQRIKVKA